LESKVTQAESLARKVEQLSSSLPLKEKDVLQRQVIALKNDLQFKMDELENDRKRIDFECRLEAMGNKLAEFEDRMSKEGENNADFMKVTSFSKSKEL
jgi:uncharacterized linocin/CFP29 family protein